MSQKLKNLTKVSTVDNTALFYSIDPTRAVNDTDVAIDKADLKNDLATGVFKRATLYISSSDNNQIAARVNGLASFTINKGELYIFYALLQSLNPRDSVQYVFVLQNKLGGTFGIGGETLVAGDINVISIISPSVADIEDFDSTQIINLGNIGTSLIEVGFNAHTFTGTEEPIQPQSDGYVIVDATQNGTVLQWLFIGAGGSYGTGGGDTANSADFSLLSGGSEVAGVNTVVGGTNVTVDNTDPNNPIVNVTAGGGDLLAANNLSDVASASTSRTNLGINTTANQTDSANKRFMTDAQETILDNTSGANTGNQIASTVTLVDTDLVVAPATELQDFADKIDHSVLKSKGTGVNTTYVSSVTVGGTTFSQPAVFGEIYSDEGYFDIHYLGSVGVTVTNLNATSTYVYIDKNGTLQQQTTIPTRQDWSRKIFTMRIAVDTSTNQIINFEYLNNPIGHYANTIRDIYTFLLAQGIPFRIGQLITGRTDNLGFDIGAGSLLELGGTGDINNANIKDLDAVSNSSYFLLTRTASDAGANTNIVKFWDNNGTITALGSTTCVGQRVYRFSSGTVAMQYGQGNYANMVLCKAGVLLEDYVLNPVLEDATFLGWWLIESTATQSSGTLLAEFVPYTIGVQGGSSSTLAGALLKGNNLSDVLDAATSRSNLGLGNIAIDFISGLIASPADATYRLIVKAPYAGTITETTTVSASGTCTATFKIGSTDLGGTANSVSSTETSQTHSTANLFSAGDDIILIVSANSTCVDMSFTIKFTKTLS